MILSTLRIVTNDFFATMRVPIVRGRAFDQGDRRGGLKVMIVSETLAEAAFPGQDPIGKRIVCCESTPDHPDWKVIVGVAGDIRSHGPAAKITPEFYLPIEQAPDDAWTWTQRSMYILARTNGDPEGLSTTIRGVIGHIDPDLPVFDMRTMDQRLRGTMATARFNTFLLTMLGIVGLVLAATGIYGVIAYFVSRRTQEIGVRMALGATRGQVVRLVVGEALKPIAVGAVIGTAGALGGGRVLASQLFNVSPTDPLTIVVATGVLASVALLASALPARRAARIDPTRALASE